MANKFITPALTEQAIAIIYRAVKELEQHERAAWQKTDDRIIARGMEPVPFPYSYAVERGTLVVQVNRDGAIVAWRASNIKVGYADVTVSWIEGGTVQFEYHGQARHRYTDTIFQMRRYVKAIRYEKRMGVWKGELA